jgi:glycogen operon protein
MSREGSSLGAMTLDDGACFRVYSGVAEQVELCLHDASGREQSRHPMVPAADCVWTHFQPGIAAGQRYGFRVHGPWDPDAGLRCNPHKLLLDPYARAWDGDFHWSAAVFDYVADAGHGRWHRDERDSAPYVPRSVLMDASIPVPRPLQQRIPWAEQVIYEANVRGFTMRHPDLSASERGRFAGLSNGQILDYLKSLGITTIELQPVHAWIDEAFLVDKGLRNYWGYNSLGFFAPAARLGGHDPVHEFREMVGNIHNAGIEVMLDVAYNHTGEGGALGPSLSFRGLDNLAYYRVEPDDPAVYINDTGCGNTLNVDHPRVQQMVLDSLRYWHQDMGVDGFRFDLAPVLGRTAEGFTPEHPLLRAIGSDPGLIGAHRVAEPWDPGPGGYQLGQFPKPWAEWNDRYRDTLRAFWRGDSIHLRDLANALGGSKHLFDPAHRGVSASVNLITAHDGFTLRDLVSFAGKHNEANGEGNRDGHGHNLSSNHGVEGPTDNPVVLAQRERHRLNLIMTLLLSRSVPMLLAGDEMGHGQGGNNNAYAQDNEIAWLDWSLLESDRAFLHWVRGLLRLRQRLSPLMAASTAGVIEWCHPQGHTMGAEDWADGRALLCRLSSTTVASSGAPVAVLINGQDREVDFVFRPDEQWFLELCSDGSKAACLADQWRMPAWSIACLTSMTEGEDLNEQGH